MTEGALESVFTFMELLRRYHLHFELRSYSDDCVIVAVSVPGERWEVEFFADGRRTIERFLSDGAVPAEQSTVLRLVGEFGEA
jgi:hypothetical protein